MATTECFSGEGTIKVNLNLKIIVLSAYLLELTSMMFLSHLQISSRSTLKPDDIQYYSTPSPNVCRPLVHFCTKERQTFGDGGSTIYILQVKFHFQTQLQKLPCGPSYDSVYKIGVPLL
jgi:hypothetical protein